MIDKVYDKYKLTCDCCGVTEEETFDTFGEALEYKQENDWSNVKDRGVWQSICPVCKEAK